MGGNWMNYRQNRLPLQHVQYIQINHDVFALLCFVGVCFWSILLMFFKIIECQWDNDISASVIFRQLTNGQWIGALKFFFMVACLTELLNKQYNCQWLETPQHLCNGTVILGRNLFISEGIGMYIRLLEADEYTMPNDDMVTATSM